MTQIDFGVIDPDTKSGTVLASDLEDFRDSVYSSHDGTSRPSYVVSGMIWVNMQPTDPIVYMYDGANDIILGVINNATSRFIPGVDAATIFADIKQAATVSATGVVELATSGETITGTDPNRVVTPSGLNATLLDHIPLKQKTVDIGDWNMNITAAGTASATATVAHGLTLANIRPWSAVIQNDAGTTHFNLNTGDTTTDTTPQGFSGAADATNITLTVLTGGIFDHLDYNATSYNRGWVTIWYVP